MTNHGSARDFDFWIGDWDVFGPQGRQVGTNSITRLFESGALGEHWHGTGGVEGRSLSSWDQLRGCWHQTWVDNSGGVLLLDGGLQDGGMVLEGLAAAADADAPPERQRITWTPSSEEVRQHWEVSSDDGATWRTAFDGRYRRRTTGAG